MPEPEENIVDPAIRSVDRDRNPEPVPACVHASCMNPASSTIAASSAGRVEIAEQDRARHAGEHPLDLRRLLRARRGDEIEVRDPTLRIFPFSRATSTVASTRCSPDEREQDAVARDDGITREQRDAVRAAVAEAERGSEEARHAGELAEAVRLIDAPAPAGLHVDLLEADEIRAIAVDRVRDRLETGALAVLHVVGHEAERLRRRAIGEHTGVVGGARFAVCVGVRNVPDGGLGRHEHRRRERVAIGLRRVLAAGDDRGREAGSHPRRRPRTRRRGAHGRGADAASVEKGRSLPVEYTG